ncbi:MAG TPA: hypothetical protein PKC70_12290 [Cellvibrionaceae bacterium]|nr:hypothetical protein [Cellvibrionaceae bacterium]
MASLLKAKNLTLQMAIALSVKELTHPTGKRPNIINPAVFSAGLIKAARMPHSAVQAAASCVKTRKSTHFRRFNAATAK